MTARSMAIASLVALGLTLTGAGGATAHGAGQHGGPGFGMAPGTMMGPGYPMGPGMMMGPGYPMGPGMMMGPGYPMGPGMMMGPGYGMWPGMMTGPRYRMAPGYRPWGLAGRDLSTKDVQAMLERQLAWRGNPRLKVGEVREENDDAIVAEIVTKKEGAVVDRLRIDRHTGWMERIE